MFKLDTTSFAANNPLNGASFSLSVSGKQLVLTFTPVPEPGHVLLLTLGATAVGGGLRRWRRGRAEEG
jgi:hypothetical protein